MQVTASSFDLIAYCVNLVRKHFEAINLLIHFLLENII